MKYIVACQAIHAFNVLMSSPLCHAQMETVLKLSYNPVRRSCLRWFSLETPPPGMQQYFAPYVFPLSYIKTFTLQSCVHQFGNMRTPNYFNKLELKSFLGLIRRKGILPHFMPRVAGYDLISHS